MDFRTGNDRSIWSISLKFRVLDVEKWLDNFGSFLIISSHSLQTSEAPSCKALVGNILHALKIDKVS